MSLAAKDRTTGDKVRVQLDLNPQQMAFVNALMADGGFDTRKDLFNNAVTLFGWAVQEARHGHVIGALDRNTKEFTVVNMPVLSYAAAIASDQHNRETQATEEERELIRNLKVSAG